MKLADAVDEILEDCLYWIEMNKERGAWLMINFPSKFLHTCKLLVNTPEFNEWGKTRFLKARNLDFDFKDGNLSKVKFNMVPGEYMARTVDTLNIHLSTTLHRLLKDGLSEKYQNRRGVSFISTPTSSFATEQDSPKVSGQLINLSRLENFKF